MTSRSAVNDENTALTGLDLAPADAQRIFEIVATGFTSSLHVETDVFERRFSLAGGSVRLRIVGRLLANAMAPGFAHLPECGELSDGSLIASLWDKSASGSMSASAGAIDDFLPRRDLTAVSTDGRWVIYRRSGSVTCLDRSLARAVGYVDSADHLALVDRGRPLYAPLLLWLRDRGIAPVHAGLVVRNGRGILIAGESGSGKTTTVLNCLLAGFDFVSDDYVGLQARAQGGYDGHGLHGSVHVHPEHLRRFPVLLQHGIAGRRVEEDKVLIPLSQVFPQRLRPSHGIDLLVLPRVTGADRARLIPATKSQALFRLAPSSLWMVRHAKGEGLPVLAALVERVPCYWLELGLDMGTIAPLLHDRTRAASAPAPPLLRPSSGPTNPFAER
jgi:hypothetical protein